MMPDHSRVADMPGKTGLSRREVIRRFGLFGLGAAFTVHSAAGCSAWSSASDDPLWDSVLIPTAQVPTITSSPSSQIAGGTTIVPSADYDTDPYFRFDGCHRVFADVSGVYAMQPEMVVPEILTDAVEAEAIFRAGRNGADVLGVRVVVDGKLSHLKLRRYDAIDGHSYHFKVQFSDVRLRHLRFEVDGANRFSGVVVGDHTVLRRPVGVHKLRHTAIGDSLQQGGANYHVGSEEPGDFFYMRLESHSRFQAALMGCDSYINLGVGGTGWVDNSHGNPYSGRVPLAIAGLPSILGFYGSRNDSDAEHRVPRAVESTLSGVGNVPVVLISGPQQAGHARLNDLIEREVVKAGRTWLDLDGIASPQTGNPTGHPTFDEQLDLARVAFDQTDMGRVREAVQRAN